MLKCLRCGAEMEEGFPVVGYSWVCVTKPESFMGCSLGRMYAAVCPQCGYTETYINNTEKLKKYIEKRRKEQ